MKCYCYDLRPSEIRVCIRWPKRPLKRTRGIVKILSLCGVVALRKTCLMARHHRRMTRRKPINVVPSHSRRLLSFWGKRLPFLYDLSVCVSLKALKREKSKRCNVIVHFVSSKCAIFRPPNQKIPTLAHSFFVQTFASHSLDI